MKTMKTIYKLMMVALAVTFAACYNDYDAPEMEKTTTETDMQAKGLEYISIKDLKARFWEKTGANAGAVASWTVDEPLYIRGKVISTDRYGSVYKTMTLFEEASQSAIDLKITSGTYIMYPAGREMFIALNGLVVGNYRGMLSIGVASTDSKYSNNNINSSAILHQHFFRGEQLGMTAADTLVVTPANYAQLTEDALGRLVRFEGVTSTFGTAKWGYKNTFPNYFANSASYDVNSDGAVDGVSWKEFISGTPTWALSGKMNDERVDTYFYGSAWFSYDKNGAGSNTNAAPGNYVVRTSGYAQFRDLPIPADGTVVDITALYTKYTNSSGRYVTYQLVLMDVEDVVEK